MWITIILLIVTILFVSKDLIFTKIVENSSDIKEYITLIKANINIKVVVVLIVLLYFIYDVKYYYKLMIISSVIGAMKYHKNINYGLNQLWKLKDGNIYINHFNII